MAPPARIRYPGDLEQLLRALVMEAIAMGPQALRGARVLYPGTTLAPSFVIRLADGHEFEVIIRDLAL